MRAVWAMAGVMAMFAGAATAATQFDLECTGSKTTTPSVGDPSETPWQARFRVDLQVGEYCQADCPRPYLMVTARPEVIVFDANEDVVSKEVSMVSRETGEFFSAHLSKLSPEGWTIKGTCSPVAFSGIPILTR